MATSSGGSTGSPPPSAECQAAKESRDLAFFDKVYNVRGQVQIFPDFMESKVTFFKKATPGKVKGPKGSRKPGTSGNSTESPGGDTHHTATVSQQQGQQKDAGGIRKKERGIKEPKSYVLDEKKLKNPNILSQLKAEECEFLVIQRVKAALEEMMEPDDPPIILLHNQDLVVKAKTGETANADKSEGEKDVLVLHPTLGVLVIEVKSTETTKIYSRFDKATTQLSHAQTSIQEEMGDLLEKDALVLTIALPKLEPEASTVIRKEAEKRKRQKQTSDVTERTKSTEKELLEDHPEILLLCGSTPEVSTEWVRHLVQLRASAGHAFKGSTVQDRLDNFKRACIRRLSIAGFRPGQSVKDSAALHRRFLLTEEQLRVRDSQAQLLHVWGPPGSGKTLLLAERARRWIKEGRRVALAVGIDWYTPLLHQLTHSVCGHKTDVARVSTHTDCNDLLKLLDTVSAADPVFVIMDEASGIVDYSKLLPHVTAGRVGGIWTADTADLRDEYKKAWHAEGGTTEQLQLCLRCPPSVMALSNAVGGTSYPPLLPPPVPVTRELGVSVEVISHADHGQSQSYRECRTCKEGVKKFFSSLGLLGDDVTSPLSLSDCVVIVTVFSVIDREREDVAELLRGLGLRAVAEDILYSTPVLLPGQTAASRDEAQWEAAMSRVLSGTDVEGRPVIHVVNQRQFLGLERGVVLVWHWDEWDEAEYGQGQKYRDVRKDWHRHYWFPAVTRCQGRLLLVAVTPSPLLSELPASSPAHGQAKSSSASSLSSPSSSSDVKTTEKRHSAGTDPTQSATSD